MQVLELKSRTDYRLEKLDGQPVWFADDAPFQSLFRAMAGQTTPLTLTHKGRELLVSQTGRGVAKFTFAQLCESPLAASDYLLLAHQFHTIFIENIPKITKDNPNYAKRFINLIDALYDNHVKLVALCAYEVQALYEGGTGFETFEFTRTQSRLIEMRALDYLQLPHGRFTKENQKG
jgi:cell division protein ZapE